MAIELLPPSPIECSGLVGFLAAPCLPEIGFGMLRSIWGLGYMTEALIASVNEYWIAAPDGIPSLEEHRKDVLIATTDIANDACK